VDQSPLIGARLCTSGVVIGLRVSRHGATR
jgi:hypothetical protein